MQREEDRCATRRREDKEWGKARSVEDIRKEERMRVGVGKAGSTVEEEERTMDWNA